MKLAKNKRVASFASKKGKKSGNLEKNRGLSSKVVRAVVDGIAILR